MAGIAFTYDVGTAIGQVRFYAGDTDGASLNKTGGDRTRTDAEILFLLNQNGQDARAAAAELLEIRAAEYAQDATWSAQGALQQDFRQRSRQCLAAAQALRANALSPLMQSSSAAPFRNNEEDGTPGTMEGW